MQMGRRGEIFAFVSHCRRESPDPMLMDRGERLADNFDGLIPVVYPAFDIDYTNHINLANRS